MVKTSSHNTSTNNNIGGQSTPLQQFPSSVTGAPTSTATATATTNHSSSSSSTVSSIISGTSSSNGNHVVLTNNNNNNSSSSSSGNNINSTSSSSTTTSAAVAAAASSSLSSSSSTTTTLPSSISSSSLTTISSSSAIIANNNSVSIADDHVREYLNFRGFTETWRAFEKECKMDRSKSLQCEKIVEQLFTFLKQYEVMKCIEYWRYLENKFFIKVEHECYDTIRKLEQSLKKYYVVNCVQTNRLDKCRDFFEEFGAELIRDDEWKEWFILPFIKLNELQNTKLEPYFNKHWLEVLYVSLYNFINTALNSIEKPQLLTLEADKRDRHSALKRRVNMLLHENESLKSKLIAAESYIAKMEQDAERRRSANMSPDLDSPSTATTTTTITTGYHWDNSSSVARANAESSLSGDEKETSSPLSSQIDEQTTSFRYSNESSTYYNSRRSSQREMQDYSKLKLLQPKRVFVGHKRQISQCRFSSEGSCIATSSYDRTVRVWSLTDRSSLLFDCGAPALTVDWNKRNENLLLSGTSNGRIKVWNVETSKCVSEAMLDMNYRNVCDIVSCPSNGHYCVASCLNEEADLSIPQKGILLGYNLKQMRVENRFPVEPDVAISGILFNHNGTMLLTAANDGMIRVYDVNTQTLIMKWRAHNGCVTSLQFSRNETSILSTGTDGRIIQWSAHHEGRILEEIFPLFTIDNDYAHTTTTTNNNNSRGSNSHTTNPYYYPNIIPKVSLLTDGELFVYNNPAVVYSMFTQSPLYSFSTPAMGALDCHSHGHEEVYIAGSDCDSHNLNLYSFIS